MFISFYIIYVFKFKKIKSKGFELGFDKIGISKAERNVKEKEKS